MKAFNPSNTLRQPGRRLLAVLSVALASALSLPALAAPHEGHYGPRHGGPGMHGSQGMHGMHGKHGMQGMQGKHGKQGMGGMGLMNPRAVERWLDAVNATPEQRSQIQQIVQTSEADRQAQAETARTLREQGQALFAQPSIDARQAEALRQQKLKQHDQASQRQMQAMLDISRVLTPEQRQQMVERMNQRRDMMQRHQTERQSLRQGPGGPGR